MHAFPREHRENLRGLWARLDDGGAVSFDRRASEGKSGKIEQIRTRIRRTLR